jgi:glutamine synthetase
MEFYATEVDRLEPLADVVRNFSEKNALELDKVENEAGERQFEIDLKPYSNLAKLIEDVLALKSFLGTTNSGIRFDALPFYSQPRSALQINLTLNDADGNNLFAKNNDSESKLLLNSVAGILGTTNSFLPLYMKSKKDVHMYDHDFNYSTYGKSGNFSPTFNVWGINNRTCSLRIPTPKNFSSREDYDLENKLSRRIEFRVPAADCAIDCAIFGVLRGALWGISNDLRPMDPTSNNVLEHNDGYERIHITGHACDFLDF